MKTKNLSFDEILKLISDRLPYCFKNDFLKCIMEYETETGHLREGLFFNIFRNGDMSWSLDPFFESSKQVKKYVETGKL